MNQVDIIQLKLEGRSTDHIWLMEDGPESHPIGVRMDCGDSGVVYLSRLQAKDLAKQLNEYAGKICLSCMGTKGEWIDRKDPRNPTYLQDNDEDVFEPCSECKGQGVVVTSKDKHPCTPIQHDPVCDCESCIYEARMSGNPDPKPSKYA